jgi:hypothetical protein
MLSEAAKDSDSAPTDNYPDMVLFFDSNRSITIGVALNSVLSKGRGKFPVPLLFLRLTLMRHADILDFFCKTLRINKRCTQLISFGRIGYVNGVDIPIKSCVHITLALSLCLKSVSRSVSQ